MLSKELSPVDWSLSAREVHNKIRGLSPWPSATAKLGGKTVKLLRSVLTEERGTKPGEIVRADKRLLVACGDLRCIEILQLQAENKKRCPPPITCGAIMWKRAVCLNKTERDRYAVFLL